MSSLFALDKSALQMFCSVLFCALVVVCEDFILACFPSFGDVVELCRRWLYVRVKIYLFVLFLLYFFPELSPPDLAVGQLGAELVGIYQFGSLAYHKIKNL